MRFLIGHKPVVGLSHFVPIYLLKDSESIGLHKDMLIKLLLRVAKKQVKCSSKGETNKSWYIHTVKYYSPIKKGELLIFQVYLTIRSQTPRKGTQDSVKSDVHASTFSVHGGQEDVHTVVEIHLTGL